MGWMKLNFDGSYDYINNENAGTRGLIRDHHGIVQMACASQMRADSPLEAEMHALLQDLQLCNGTFIKKL